MFDRISQSSSFWPGVLLGLAAIAVGAWLGTSVHELGGAVVAGLGGLVGGLFVASGIRAPGLAPFAQVARDVAAGKRPKRPAMLKDGPVPEGAEDLFEALEETADQLAERKTSADGESKSLREEAKALRDEAARLDRLAQEETQKYRRLEARLEEQRREASEAEGTIRTTLDDLSGGLGEQMAAVEQTATSMREMSAA
ncbi:MAG: hypothetical protein KC586_28930, partial [Myxococcales bacterium]|nr:hypothetical protein [Myxococcales bacterium]